MQHHRERVPGHHGRVPWGICVQWCIVLHLVHQRRQLRLWELLQWWSLPAPRPEWGGLHFGRCVHERELRWGIVLRRQLRCTSFKHMRYYRRMHL
jgi:hypothetical protein